MNSFHFPSLRQAMIWLLLIIVASFAIGGIIMVFDNPDPEYKAGLTKTVAIPLDDISKARVNLVVDSGSISLSSETLNDFLTGDVTLTSKGTPPGLSHTMSNGTANIVIDRPTQILHDIIGGDENWNVSLHNSTPTSLLLSLGTGDIHLTPKDAMITELAVENGAGSLFMDLHEWNGKVLPVRIDNGVGEITIIFPEESMVSVNLDRAVGNLFLTGFSGKEQKYYHHTDVASAPVMNVTISQGLGDITLKTE